MDGAAVLDKPLNIPVSMPNTKERKEKTMNAIKAKLEQAKLNLIYIELEELNIPFNRNYDSVDKLVKSLKRELSELDFNRVQGIVKKVEDSLNTMVQELEKGSTNAFTKFMTSDLTKTIAKSLGIALAGRTALLLAPTVGTKALVGAGLAGYGLYKIIKNRKEIIVINETNELNNILRELEVTKEDDTYIDTRFDLNAQSEIRRFLADLKISFDDTGYRSLRQTIYSLDNEQKKSLCFLLNSKLGKGIDIEGRVAKAKRKLNVIASGAAGISAGASLGMQAATAVNSVDPALTAGVLNGTLLAKWVEKITQLEWFSKLSGGLGIIGSEVLEHLPVVGGVATKIFAAENLATFATIGAAGGLAVSTALGLASSFKSIHDVSVAKKENEKYLKLDNEKYGEVDKVELEAIAKKLNEPANLGELAVLDIVNGYLKDENIKLEETPNSIASLKKEIDKLKGEEKRKAEYIVNEIEKNMSSDPDFIQKLKKAGKISIGLFTGGLAVMSVYDIIKGGTFLPELSKKLFPNNNIYNPVEVPPAYDQYFNVSKPEEAKMQAEARELYKQFNSPDYYAINDGTYMTEYGSNFMKHNPNFEGIVGGTGMVNAGIETNFVDNLSETGFFKWVSKVLGLPEKTYEMVPNIPALCAKIDEFSPKELYAFYRYVNSLYVPGGSDKLDAIKEILGYESYLNKVTDYIGSYENKQKFNDLVIKVSQKLSTGAIPFATALATLGIIKKQETKDDFKIQDEEIEEAKKKLEEQEKDNSMSVNI